MFVIAVGSNASEVQALNEVSQGLIVFMMRSIDKVFRSLDGTPVDAVFLSSSADSASEPLHDLATALIMARGRPLVASLSREDVEARKLLLYADALVIDGDSHPEVIVAGCRALIRRSHGMASNEVRFGSLVGNMANGKFVFRDRVLKLPPDEAKLLAFLIMKSHEYTGLLDLSARCAAYDVNFRRRTIEARIASICGKLNALHRHAPSIVISSAGAVRLSHRNISFDHGPGAPEA